MKEDWEIGATSSRNGAGARESEWPLQGRRRRTEGGDNDDGEIQHRIEVGKGAVSSRVCGSGVGG